MNRQQHTSGVQRRLLGLVLILVGIGAAAVAPMPLDVQAQADGEIPPDVRVVRADETGLVVEWRSPPVEIRAGGDGTVAVEVAGYWETTAAGAPRLPYTSRLIAVPTESTLRLRVSVDEHTFHRLPGPLALAPRPDGVIRGEDGLPVGVSFAAEMEERAGPSTAVTIEDVGVLRGVQLARITFYPAIREGSSLRLTRWLQVEVSWEGAEQASDVNSDPILDQVRAAVLNPDNVRPGRRAAAQVESVAANGLPTAYLEVSSPGLYEVEYDDVDELGFVGANPANLRLFQGGDEIAYEWIGDGDATFEAGESIRFYAEPRFSRWTAVDVFRLVVDESAGLRMGERSGNPSGLPGGVPWVTAFAEENEIYTPDSLPRGSLPFGRDGDRWVWERMRVSEEDSASFPVDAEAVDSAEPSELVLWFISYTGTSANPDHRVDIEVNGTSVGYVEWDGKKAISHTVGVPAGVVGSGTNSVDLTLPGISGVSVEEMWVDAVELRYPRGGGAAGSWVSFEANETAAHDYEVTLASGTQFLAYDVTDIANVQKLTAFSVSGNMVTVGDPPAGGPRRYVVVSGVGVQAPVRVRGPEDPWEYGGGGAVTGADLLIITHPDLAGELSPLVEVRESQGLATVVVNVLGVYDAWGEGRVDPEAIRAFIAETYQLWTPQPVYVLLVGDGYFDPKQYMVGYPETLIPPYLAAADLFGNETAADNRYVCVDGDDRLPEMILSRLAVGTAQDAETVVNKIVEYETTALPGGWDKRVLLVADDPDPAGDHPAVSDSSAAVYVGEPYTLSRLYCDGSDPAGYTDCVDPELANIRGGVSGAWNAGLWLIEQTGHASWQQWAHEDFFHLDDVAGLSNGGRLPVVVEMTCFTGSFHRPEPTLDREMVRHAGGGAVAAWGPTGLGVSTGHDHLSEGFFEAVLLTGVGTVGEAALAGKLALAAAKQHLDLLDTFVLLGDGSLRWAKISQVYLPLAMR